MATTTNYSWTTPDDTDLVKDGAAAIRTLGSAIDTTVFNNAGAAVAKSTIDAKGDLLVGTADNTVGRLAVGTDGYTLVADSVEATGLKWGAPAAPAFVGASAYLGETNVSYTADTAQAISLTSESWDTDSFHSTVTNTSRMTIPSGKGGYYQINAFVKNSSPTTYFLIRINKNGSPLTEWADSETARVASGSALVLSTSGVASLVAGDYIEIIAQQGGTASVGTRARLDLFKVG